MILEQPEIPTHRTVIPNERKKPVMGILSCTFSIIPVLVCFHQVSAPYSSRISIPGLKLGLYFIPVVIDLFCIPGLIFGFIGIFQEKRSKALSIIGIVLNYLFILGSLLVVYLALNYAG